MATKELISLTEDQLSIMKVSMQKHIKIGLIMAAFLLLTGCNYRVTVISSPAYGIIYANGERIGHTKVRLSYKVPKDCFLRDSLTLPEYTANWYSFASEDTIHTIPKGQRQTTVVLISSKFQVDSMHEQSIRAAKLKLRRAKSLNYPRALYQKGY